MRFFRYFFLSSLVAFVSFFTENVRAENLTSQTMSAHAAQKILQINDAFLSGTKTKTRTIFEKRIWLNILEREDKVKQVFWGLFPTVDRTLSYTLTLQKYKLSCEIAALKIIVSALGKNVTEEDIMSVIPHYAQEFDSAAGVWGDPDREFVGYYTGSQRKMTGYGIYEKPLASYIEGQFHTKAWNQYTRPNDMTDQEHLTRLLSSLDHGGHVILWGDWCTDPRYEDALISGDKTLLTKIFPIPGKNSCERFGKERTLKWKTSNGEEKIGLSGEHAFVLLGYVGKLERPTYIIVWDTDTGRHVYPIHEWMRKWKSLENRSLLIRDFE